MLLWLTFQPEFLSGLSNIYLSWRQVLLSLPACMQAWQGHFLSNESSKLDRFVPPIVMFFLLDYKLFYWAFHLTDQYNNIFELEKKPNNWLVLIIMNRRSWAEKQKKQRNFVAVVDNLQFKYLCLGLFFYVYGTVCLAHV